MRLNDIDFTGFQNNLIYANNQSEKIRGEMGLTGLSVKDKNFFAIIESKLQNMGFEIYYTDKLQNFEFNGKVLGHIPSITIFKDKYNKENGGSIYIYKNYSPKKKRELLIHELIHIKDTITPTLSNNDLDTNNVFMLSIYTLKRIEMFTELVALALMMPNTVLQSDLFNCAYDMNKIENDYRAVETSTIMMWIMLNDYFHGHYAMLYQFKSANGPLLQRVDEFSNAESKFDIANIVLNTGSIAYKSWTTRQSQSGESTIDNKNYQCFCFYEKDIQQPLPSDTSPVEMIIKCDKMVIIGWSKNIYDFIQKLKFK